MACENWRALGCTPASASEESLKVDIYRTAKSQLFHPLTTWGSIHVLIWTRLTTFWCVTCMILLATIIFDHRCQLPPDLNHYCSNTCNFSNPNICNPNQYRNAFSKYLYSCTAFFLPRKKISSSVTQPSEDPKSLAIFQPAKSVWQIQINSIDANSCGDRLGK